MEIPFAGPLLHALFVQREQPRACARIVRHVGVTAHTFTGEALVDHARKAGIFNFADGLAGVQLHALAAAGVLHAAGRHTE